MAGKYYFSNYKTEMMWLDYDLLIHTYISFKGFDNKLENNIMLNGAYILKLLH